MRKLIPHALLAFLTLGAGLGALTSFQSTRFSAARAALVAAPCISEVTGQSIPVSNTPLEAIIPSSAVDNAGLYATPSASGLVAVAPYGWLCHVVAPNVNASGIDIRNSDDPTSPVSVLQFTTAVGPSAEQVACPFSNEAKDRIFNIGGDMLVKSTCAMSEFVSISAHEGEYVFITAKGDPSQPLYGVIAYSTITDSANVGICVPSDTLTPGKPSYVFDRSTCKQYLRAFARNNPMK
jgi:hypothetical protein